MGARPWFEEVLLALVSGKHMLKKLRIKAESTGGLQHHRFKDEGGILLEGEMITHYSDVQGGFVDKTIKSSDTFHFRPEEIHQEDALTDYRINEASTPQFNDRVRVEELYDLGAPGGLPTTTEDEIKFY